MLLKITGRSPELFQENLTAVLNIATVFCQGGYIPTEQEQDDPEGHGRYWRREDQRFHLFPSANNHWAHVQEETETSIVLSFRYRYDRNGLMDNLTNLLYLRFQENADLIQE